MSNGDANDKPNRVVLDSQPEAQVPGDKPRDGVETTSLNDLLVLSDREYHLIRDLVYKWFGINLTEQKRALIVGRLNKVLREHNFATFQEYYDYVVKDSTGKALTTLVDRISTNHTFFYREFDHFEFLQSQVLPDMIQQRAAENRRKLRIWVAGCSSGEESYMIAILLKELLGKDINRWDLGILATDISMTALEKAVKGVYTHENVEHMPPGLRNKYFTRLPDKSYRLNDDIRGMVTHRKLNLMRSDYPFKGQFEVILCRNVMIYFDRPTRDALVERFHRYLLPGGYLFIGHSETLGRNNELFRYIRPAIYRKES